MIEAHGITLRYGHYTILKDVNWIVHAGEFWFLIGPNGAGKSTLLAALLGLMNLDDGYLYLHPGLTDRSRIGYVPQRCDMNPTLPVTVQEFVSLGLVGLGTSRSKRIERLTFAFRHAALEGLEELNYWSLSGGQRQRTLLARALVRRPGLLVTDEPTAGLDATSTRTFLECLAALNREGVTVLFVTQELVFSQSFGSHAALFSNGRVETGRAVDILRPENLYRIFGRDLHPGMKWHDEPRQ